MHERALQALTADGRGDLAAMARHAAGAGRFDDFVALARDGRPALPGAGVDASRRSGWPEDALSEEPEDPTLLAVATESAWLVSLYDEALGYCDRWYGGADRTGDADQQAAALRWRLRLHHEMDQPALVDADRARLEGLIEQLPVGERRARAMAAIAQAHMLEDHTDEAVAWADRAIAEAEAVGAGHVAVQARIERASALNVRDAGAADELRVGRRCRRGARRVGARHPGSQQPVRARARVHPGGPGARRALPAGRRPGRVRLHEQRHGRLPRRGDGLRRCRPRRGPAGQGARRGVVAALPQGGGLADGAGLRDRLRGRAGRGCAGGPGAARPQQQGRERQLARPLPAGGGVAAGRPRRGAALGRPLRAGTPAQQPVRRERCAQRRRPGSGCGRGPDRAPSRLDGDLGRAPGQGAGVAGGRGRAAGRGGPGRGGRGAAGSPAGRPGAHAPALPARPPPSPSGVRPCWRPATGPAPTGRSAAPSTASWRAGLDGAGTAPSRSWPGWRASPRRQEASSRRASARWQPCSAKA